MLSSYPMIPSSSTLDTSIYSISNLESTETDTFLQPESVLSKVLSDADSKRRRQWSEEEDEALRRAVHIEHPDGGAPYKWLEVSKHITGRSNKDCRKRWYNKMSSPRALKGSWSPEEDATLVRAVKLYGPKWQLVSAMVKTRKGCQCARRWYDTLNPAIDKTSWSAEEDAILLAAVNDHGKKWSYISQTYFPGRTGLAAKNRFFALVTSTMKRRRGASESLEERKANHMRHDPYEANIDRFSIIQQSQTLSSLQSVNNPFDFSNTDTHVGSDGGSSSSSRSQSPSSLVALDTTFCGRPVDIPRIQTDSDVLSQALANFEYELSCQMKPAIWTGYSSISNYPSSISPTSTSSSPYDSPITPAEGRWDPWDAEILRLFH